MIFTAIRPADTDGHSLANRSTESLRALLADGWLYVGFISIDAELTWREARNAFVLGLEYQVADEKRALANAAAGFGGKGSAIACQRVWEQLMAEVAKFTAAEATEYGSYRIAAPLP
jgi:hypothetical protein